MTSTRIRPDDPCYPPALAGAHLSRHARQSTLYLRGSLPRGPGIAVVGTRDPSPEAVRFTHALVRDLAAAGYCIWSGGALGIDAAAHEQALASEVPTVVVTGGGLSWPYPKKHVPLFDRIVRAGGALLARVPDDVPPLRAGFLLRNELLAALTVATVVIEAGISSGARSTAGAARRLGRPLCVVPHAPWSDRGAGCAHELANGARAITTAADVLAAIGEGPQKVPAKRSAVKQGREQQAILPWTESSPIVSTPFGSNLGPTERAVLAVLNERPSHIDEICERTSLSLSAVVEALLTLTLHAVVVEGPAGSYRRHHHGKASSFPPDFPANPPPESIVR